MRKYKNIDLYIINEKEIRHEFRDKVNKVEILMKKIKTTEYKFCSSNKRFNGSVLYSSKKILFYCEH